MLITINSEGLKTRLHLSISQEWFQLKKDFAAQKDQDVTHILGRMWVGSLLSTKKSHFFLFQNVSKLFCFTLATQLLILTR